MYVLGQKPSFATPGARTLGRRTHRVWSPRLAPLASGFGNGLALPAPSANLLLLGPKLMTDQVRARASEAFHYPREPVWIKKIDKPMLLQHPFARR